MLERLRRRAYTITPSRYKLLRITFQLSCIPRLFFSGNYFHLQIFFLFLNLPVCWNCSSSAVLSSYCCFSSWCFSFLGSDSYFSFTWFSFMVIVLSYFSFVTSLLKNKGFIELLNLNGFILFRFMGKILIFIIHVVGIC